jgi:hypothetical protein
MSVLLRVLLVMALAGIAFPCSEAFCYYDHAGYGTTDAATFLTAYPSVAGTKLDSCNTCHLGSSGTTCSVAGVGSCNYCHTASGENTSYNFQSTLNSYGLDYLVASQTLGRTVAALQSIESNDSDGDTYSNITEILTFHYPGDSCDTPAMVAAPSRVFSLSEIERMPRHDQFMLMNTTKQVDWYCEYTGVTMQNFLEFAGILPSATSVTVYAPDGYSQTFPLQPGGPGNSHYLYGTYPAAEYYYNAQADVALNPTNPPTTYGGWCDYSSPFCAGRINGSPIYNRCGLQVILAYKRDGQPLAPGYLDSTNTLQGEGPFRIVPPQLQPSPPDQNSTAPTTNSAGQPWVWPYDPNADHNAGPSVKSTTILGVLPLPANTTSIDTSEQWNYVDQDQVVVYGAIDPIPNVISDIKGVISYLSSLPSSSFTKPCFQKTAINEFDKLLLSVYVKPEAALKDLQNEIAPQFAACDSQHYLTDCTAQTKVSTSIHVITVYLQIPSDSCKMTFH